MSRSMSTCVHRLEWMYEGPLPNSVRRRRRGHPDTARRILTGARVRGGGARDGASMRERLRRAEFDLVVLDLTARPECGRWPKRTTFGRSVFSAVSERHSVNEHCSLSQCSHRRPEKAGHRAGRPGSENAKTPIKRDFAIACGTGRDPDLRVRIPLGLNSSVTKTA